MRAQARALVAKGVRALVLGTGSLQERLAAALPESGWLVNDANAYGALTQDEVAYVDEIRAPGSAQATLELTDEEAAEIALAWWLLFDLLSTTS